MIALPCPALLCLASPFIFINWFLKPEQVQCNSTPYEFNWFQILVHSHWLHILRHLYMKSEWRLLHRKTWFAFNGKVIEVNKNPKIPSGLQTQFCFSIFVHRGTFWRYFSIQIGRHSSTTHLTSADNFLIFIPIRPFSLANLHKIYAVQAKNTHWKALSTVSIYVHVLKAMYLYVIPDNDFFRAFLSLNTIYAH